MDHFTVFLLGFSVISMLVILDEKVFKNAFIASMAFALLGSLEWLTSQKSKAPMTYWVLVSWLVVVWLWVVMKLVTYISAHVYV